MSYTRDGRFKLVRRLGSGACGVVFEALDLLHHKKVAVKLLTEVTGDALIAFKREFRSVEHVRHPNLVSRYELLSDGRIWFFTMEMIEGLELLEYLARNEIARTSMPADSAVRTIRQRGLASAFQTGRPSTVPTPSIPRLLSRQYLRDLRVTLKQLVDGVCALHDAGHLHRDIKPSNVLVTREGRVVLVDFGLVVPIEHSADPLIAGTPGYMSPEQAGSTVLTPASDWFSVGVLLYQAVTGQMPWPFDAQGRLSRDVTPVAPREIVPDVPPDLSDLALAMIAFDPAARPSSDEVRRAVGADTLRFSLPAVRPGTLGQPGFVGRVDELTACHEAFVRAAAGECVTVAVHGEPGIGKTTLVNEFFDELRTVSDAVIFTGRCSAREWIPFNAVDGLVESLARALSAANAPNVNDTTAIAELAALFPVLESVEAFRRGVRPKIGDGAPDLARAAAAFASLLRLLARERPVVIFIDDAQWGDLDSARFLGALLDLAPPLLLMCAYTSEDAATGLMLRALGEVLHQVDVQLEPLSTEDSSALSRAILLQWPHPSGSAENIAELSGGNPFLVDFLSRHLAGDRQAMSLGEALAEECATLDADARALLALLAVAGEPLELPIAYEVAAMNTQAFDVVSALRERRLARSRITGTLEELEIYHPRIRAAVLDGLDAATVAGLHRRLAEHMEHARVSEPERLFTHYVSAGCASDAARCAVAAAESAARAYAWDRAVALYDDAFRLDQSMVRVHAAAYADAVRHAEDAAIPRTLSRSRGGSGRVSA